MCSVVRIRPSTRSVLIVGLLVCAWTCRAQAQALENGTVIDPVPCLDDPAQTYALYVPSAYSTERTWPASPYRRRRLTRSTC